MALLTDICFLSAAELAHAIRKRDVSAVEVLEAHLEQIERVNPKVNALVTVVAERARMQARFADHFLSNKEILGPLHGVPVAHKDLVETRGIRTTFGSPIFQDFVPDRDALIVQRLARTGTVTVGKSNTPEFGAGSQTFNEVFGETLNPYDLTRTCGGSSGGAATALACGMVPLADGSDLGGSLRNPASFCNVVGFRPSPGRVPSWPAPDAWFGFSVVGPMARNVADVALMLSVIAGPDPLAPQSIHEPASVFAQPLERDLRGVKIAWAPDLNGSFPVDREVRAVLDAQRKTFEGLGCIVEDACPDFSGADEVFRTWRAWHFELAYGSLLDSHRAKLKDTVIWNIEEGRKLTGPDLARAAKMRTELFHRLREFFDRYDYLVLTVAQVPPFDVKQRWVDEINGKKLATYLDWMQSCYLISATGLPSLSVPCGFTASGLPVGVQLVGRYHGDFSVLQLGHAFEQATRFCERRPPIVAEKSRLI